MPNVTVHDVAREMHAYVRDCEEERYAGYVEYVHCVTGHVIGFVPRDPSRRKMWVYNAPDAELVVADGH